MTIEDIRKENQAVFDKIDATTPTKYTTIITMLSVGSTTTAHIITIDKQSTEKIMAHRNGALFYCVN